MKFNKIRNFIVGISFIFLFSINSNAQDLETTSDLELWSTAGLSIDLNDRWKVSLDQEFRFTRDMSRFDTYFTDLGVDYKINKHFSLGANYRFYQNKNNDDLFKTEHRISADIKYKQKINRFKLGYRLRFQNKDEEFYTGGSENNLYNIRNRFSLDYNINNFKIDPFTEIELYRQINTINSTELSKIRWTIGLEYDIKKLGDIELFYRIDKELNLSYDKVTYILGIGYEYSF